MPLSRHTGSIKKTRTSEMGYKENQEQLDGHKGGQVGIKGLIKVALLRVHSE